MDWVLDSSLALALALPDEMSNKADHFLAQISKKDLLWVPALWWYEVSNAITTAHRRQRLAEVDRMHLVELYGRLPIQTDNNLDTSAIWRFHVLAEQYTLSAYDAAYLDLARRKGIGLATLDRHLIKAAQRAGIKVFVSK